MRFFSFVVIVGVELLQLMSAALVARHRCLGQLLSQCERFSHFAHIENSGSSRWRHSRIASGRTHSPPAIKKRIFLIFVLFSMNLPTVKITNSKHFQRRESRNKPTKVDQREYNTLVGRQRFACNGGSIDQTTCVLVDDAQRSEEEERQVVADSRAREKRINRLQLM